VKGFEHAINSNRMAINFINVNNNDVLRARCD